MSVVKVMKLVQRKILLKSKIKCLIFLLVLKDVYVAMTIELQ